MRNFVRAHAKEISYLQSGEAADIEAFTMEAGETLPELLQRLGEQQVNQAELLSEVQRVIRVGLQGAYANQDALDRATSFMHYLQGSYEEQLSQLPPEPPQARPGRRTRRSVK
jgi:hypothetical protein